MAMYYFMCYRMWDNVNSSSNVVLTIPTTILMMMGVFHTISCFPVFPLIITFLRRYVLIFKIDEVMLIMFVLYLGFFAFVKS